MPQEKVIGKDKFRDFFHMAAHREKDVDYSITTREVSGSNVTIVAPHGGIETGTKEMAKFIAADDFNLYIFDSLKSAALYESGGDWAELHITSINFNEPRCVELVAKSDITLTIHGSRMVEPVVCLSSLDKKLESKLMKAFNAAGIKAISEGHRYQTGTQPENICNKNKRGQGVQLEFSKGIRENPVLRKECVRLIRETLKAA